MDSASHSPIVFGLSGLAQGCAVGTQNFRLRLHSPHKKHNNLQRKVWAVFLLKYQFLIHFRDIFMNITRNVFILARRRVFGMMTILQIERSGVRISVGENFFSFPKC
jgi:hypothetical protein